MAWYRAGTCSVTSENPVVTGAGGTAWAANIQAGDAFLGPDGKTIEVQSVNSDVSITLARNYAGATASLQEYDIIPTQGRVRDLAAQVLQLITDYGAVKSAFTLSGNNVGIGVVPTAGLHVSSGTSKWAHLQSAGAASSFMQFSRGGSAAALGYIGSDGGGAVSGGAGANLAIRAEGDLLLAAGGNVTRMTVLNSGSVGIGTSSPGTRLEVSGSASIARITGAAGTAPRLELSSAGVVNWSLQANGAGASELTVFQDAAERMRIDSSGNVGIGTSNPAALLHTHGGNIRVRSTSDGSNGLLQFVDAAGTLRGSLYAAGASYLALEANGAVPIVLSNNSVERQRIDASGNSIFFTQAAPPSLSTAGAVVLNMTSDTNLRVSVRGGDGVTRTANWALA